MKSFLKVYQKPEATFYLKCFGVFSLVCVIAIFTVGYFIERNNEMHQREFAASVIGIALEEKGSVEDGIIDYSATGKVSKDLRATGENLIKDYSLSLKHSLLEKAFSPTQLYLLIFVALLLLSAFTLLTCILNRIYKDIDDIHVYVNHAVAHQEFLNLASYQEGTLSILKNDIHQLYTEILNRDSQNQEDKERLRDSIGDITHQLKTPLSAMYILTDLIEASDRQEDKEVLVQKSIVQLDKMNWLINALLKTARLDMGMIVLQNDKVKAIRIINEAITQLEFHIRQKNIKLQFNEMSDIIINCDYHYTVEAFTNILKNGIEHSSQNGTIRIVVENNPLYTAISIEDEGAGISQKDLPYLFKRFYKSKNSKSDSVGIGLYLAHKIMEHQDGVIEVESEENKGSTFVMKFYKMVV